jgi:hypothetical protein
MMMLTSATPQRSASMPYCRSRKPQSATTNDNDARRTATTSATRPPARLAVSQVTGSVTRMGMKVRTLSSCRLRRQWPFVLLSAGSGARKWGWQASNLRPSDYESLALTD